MGKKSSVYLEIEQQMKEKSKVSHDIWLLGIIFVLLIPFLCTILVKKPHEYVSDINNLPEPIQTEASGGTVITVYGEKVYVDFLAEYDIQGLVLAKKAYAEILVGSYNKIVNKIGPRDFVLGWGALGKKENMDLMRWSEYGDRYVQPYIKEYTDEYFDWYDREFSGDYKHGKFGTIGLNFSNNHPVSDSRKIRRLLKKIKVGDVVRIKGYLIYIHPEHGTWHWGPSSLVRDDHGCEIIYVTDISWLKEK